VSAQIIQGDCRDVLATLPSGSVQMCATSPPYFGLRKYSDSDAEIGQEQTVAAYVAALVEVFRGVWRVLRDDGTLWLNLGDSFVNNPSTTTIPRAEQGNGSGAFGIYGEHQHQARKGTPNRATPMIQEGLKKKDLIGIPWRVAFALQADGWYLRSDMIWNKPNCMPESVTDRPTRSHEYVFLLTKSTRYFYDQDAIREPHQRLWNERNGGSWAHPEKQPNGSNAGHHSGAYPLPNPAGRNKRTVWTIPTRPYAGAHFAVWPEQLVEPMVLAGSRRGDTVLDPFCGSGTTLKVAEQHGRNSIGIELNPAYIAEQAEQRLNGVQVSLVSEVF